MANPNPGLITSRIEILAGVTPANQNSQYPTHYPEFGIGGLRRVDVISGATGNQTCRNTIFPARRELGMLVFVEADSKYYQLTTNPTTDETTNSDWTEFSSGTSTAGSRLTATVSNTSGSALTINRAYSISDYNETTNTITVSSTTVTAAQGGLIWLEAGIAIGGTGPGILSGIVQITNLTSAARDSELTITTGGVLAATTATGNVVVGIVVRAGATNQDAAFDGLSLYKFVTPSTSGGGTVTVVTGSEPIEITSTATTTPNVTIRAAAGGATPLSGSMSANDKLKLDGVPNLFDNMAAYSVGDQVVFGNQLFIVRVAIPANSTAADPTPNATWALAGTVENVTSNTPAVTLGSNTQVAPVITVADVVSGGNSGLMPGADKAKLDAAPDLFATSTAYTTGKQVFFGQQIFIALQDILDTNTTNPTPGAIWALIGTVTNVTGTAPVQVATGTTTPVISVDNVSTTANGLMLSTDKVKVDASPNAWVPTGTTYAAGDQVVHNQKLYIYISTDAGNDEPGTPAGAADWAVVSTSSGTLTDVTADGSTSITATRTGSTVALTSPDVDAHLAAAPVVFAQLTAYAIGDQVLFGNRIFIALQAVMNTNTTDPVAGAVWALVGTVTSVTVNANTPAVTVGANPNTAPVIAIANAVSGGNSGLLEGADKLHIDTLPTVWDTNRQTGANPYATGDQVVSANKLYIKDSTATNMTPGGANSGWDVVSSSVGTVTSVVSSSSNILTSPTTGDVGITAPTVDALVLQAPSVFNSAAGYSINDQVFYLDKLWRARQDLIAGSTLNTPDTDAANWTEVASIPVWSNGVNNNAGDTVYYLERIWLNILNTTTGNRPAPDAATLGSLHWVELGVFRDSPHTWISATTYALADQVVHQRKLYTYVSTDAGNDEPGSTAGNADWAVAGTISSVTGTAPIVVSNTSPIARNITITNATDSTDGAMSSMDKSHIDAIPQEWDTTRDVTEFLTRLDQRVFSRKIYVNITGNSAGNGSVSQNSNPIADTVNWRQIDGNGHIIEDSAGTDLTQRSNLQFTGTGVAVSDDSGNDRTIINITSGSGGGVQVNGTSVTNIVTGTNIDAAIVGSTATLNVDNQITQTTTLTNGAFGFRNSSGARIASTLDFTVDNSGFVWNVNRAVAITSIDGAPVNLPINPPPAITAAEVVITAASVNGTAIANPDTAVTKVISANSDVITFANTTQLINSVVEAQTNFVLSITFTLDTVSYTRTVTISYNASGSPSANLTATPVHFQDPITSISVVRNRPLVAGSVVAFASAFPNGTFSGDLNTITFTTANGITINTSQANRTMTEEIRYTAAAGGDTGPNMQYNPEFAITGHYYYPVYTGTVAVRADAIASTITNNFMQIGTPMSNPVPAAPGQGFAFPAGTVSTDGVKIFAIARIFSNGASLRFKTEQNSLQGTVQAPFAQLAIGDGPTQTYDIYEAQTGRPGAVTLFVETI